MIRRDEQTTETADYAQTNLQLYTQLVEDGYPPEALVLVRDAYGLAVHLFAGWYRPSGKTFIDHVVGTASILASLDASPELVAAGLLHAAYDQGDFGPLRSERARRADVRAAVGDAVEEYVARYAVLPWNRESIRALHDGIDAAGPMKRRVVLMRLANLLEDHLDLGILFCVNARVRCNAIRNRGTLLVDLARKLGEPRLAGEIERAFEKILNDESQAGSWGDVAWRRARLLLPPSYRTRWRSLLSRVGT